MASSRRGRCESQFEMTARARPRRGEVLERRQHVAVDDPGAGIPEVRGQAAEGRVRHRASVELSRMPDRNVRQKASSPETPPYRSPAGSAWALRPRGAPSASRKASVSIRAPSSRKTRP